MEAGTGRRWLSTLAVASLAMALAYAMAYKMLLVAHGGVHGDVASFLHAARELVQHGSLENAAAGLPFDIMEAPVSEAHDRNFPFYSSALLGVLMLVPFVHVFDSATVAPFLAAQLACLTILVSCIYLLRNRDDRLLPLALFTLLVVWWGMDGSILVSATQLPLMILMLLVWRYRTYLIERPILIGLVTVIGVAFRPEALGILLGFIACRLVIRVPLKTALVWFAKAAGATVVASMGMTAIGGALGAVSPETHVVTQLGIYSLTSGHGAFFGPINYSMTDLVTWPGNIYFVFKLGRAIANFPYIGLRDSPFPALVALLFAVGLLGRMTRMQRADLAYTFAFAFTVFGGYISGIQIRRYLEFLTFATFLFVATHWRVYWSFAKVHITESAMEVTAIVTAAFIIIATSQQITSLPQREEALRAVGEDLSEFIGTRDLVFADHAEMWEWYGRGERTLMYFRRKFLIPELVERGDPDWVLLTDRKGPLPDTLSGLAIHRVIRHDGYYGVGVYR